MSKTCNYGRRKIKQDRLGDHEISQLSLDARETERNGFGRHYGAYMAAVQAGHVKRKLVEEQEAPELPKEPEAKEPEKPTIARKVCTYCGKPIMSRRLRYCSDECYEAQKRINEEKWREAQKERCRQDKKCEWCGENWLTGKQKRFCCNSCYNKAVYAEKKQLRLAAEAVVI